MKSVIYLLIIFFIVLILWEIFLAHFIVEGMDNSTSTTNVYPTNTSNSTLNSIDTLNQAILSQGATGATGPSGTITPAPSVSSSSINSSTINASSVNTTNPSYLPYTSTSQSSVSFVEQNANNISFLKNKMDNLYQQVQDISGNVSILSNSTAQIGKVNNVINTTQSSLTTSPPTVSGTSQPQSTLDSASSYANSLVTT